MSQGLRRAFRIFTFVLLFVSILTAYMNVFSDDTAVRAGANQLARTHAKCGDKCKVTDMHGDRGMLETRVEFQMEGAGAGHYTVVCRRAYVFLGDYTCAVASAP